MKSPSRSTVIKYVGTAVAVLVPAIVVAQSMPDFVAGNILRARDLQTLSDALEQVLPRVSAVETRVGALTLSKDRVYSPPAGNTPVSDGAGATASSSCMAPADIMLTCSCNGAGSTQIVLHTITVTGNDTPGTAAQCTCNMVSSGAVTARALATCLRVQ
jgi:hypothetical protein